MVPLNPLLVSPVEILTGVPLALLFGTFVAMLVALASFVVTHFSDWTVPPVAGGVLVGTITAIVFYAVGVVGSNGSQSGLALGLVLVVALGSYATSWGKRIATDLPRLGAGAIERTQPLAGDAIDSVDAMGQVTIRSSGGVREFEGYPPLGPKLRATLENGSWRLPADLPLSELEIRLEDQLRTSHDLTAVAVSIDRRGRATITAAPPANGVAKAVPEGWRAVSIRALLPTGLAPGDDVLVATDSTTVSGTVLGATVDVSATLDDSSAGGDETAPRDDRLTSSESGGAAAVETIGGDGRVTVAVPTTDAETVLGTDRARIVVTPRETSDEFDAISLLERGGAAIRTVRLTESILDAVNDDDTDLTVFAIRQRGGRADGTGHEREWEFEPDRTALATGAEAFVLGTDATMFGAEENEPDPTVLEVSR